MRVYVTTHQLDGGMTWDFHPTKAAAKAYIRELRERYPDADWRNPDDPSVPEIRPYDVTPTREGIADALNSFVTWTCINEH